ncbi:MAG TPA: hypothetical protein VGK31_09015 [Thermoanaerobaculia bacterium]|jgi:hypothetical protein
MFHGAKERGTSELACNLGALNPAERRAHDALTKALIAAVSGRGETEDGYTFRIDKNRVTLAQVGEWIALEQRCCPFFDFRLDLRNDGVLTLALGGPEGVREFIDAEFGFGERASRAQ